MLGPAEEALAIYQGSYSYVTDTPDFWRRAEEPFPNHGDRFTGEPAYFHHVTAAGSKLMELKATTATDDRYAVFHQPNTKFPARAAKMLGFNDEQIGVGLLADEIGNVYSGSCMVGLTAILDVAQAGDRILMVSYGSGAGSDAFDILVTERLEAKRNLAPSTREYIERRSPIDYGSYVRFRGKLKD